MEPHFIVFASNWKPHFLVPELYGTSERRTWPPPQQMNLAALNRRNGDLVNRRICKPHKVLNGPASAQHVKD
jgi:hypothetical protein